MVQGASDPHYKFSEKKEFTINEKTYSIEPKKNNDKVINYLDRYTSEVKKMYDEKKDFFFDEYGQEQNDAKNILEIIRRDLAKILIMHVNFGRFASNDEKAKILEYVDRVKDILSSREVFGSNLSREKTKITSIIDNHKEKIKLAIPEKNLFEKKQEEFFASKPTIEKFLKEKFQEETSATSSATTTSSSSVPPAPPAPPLDPPAPESSSPKGSGFILTPEKYEYITQEPKNLSESDSRLPTLKKEYDKALANFNKTQELLGKYKKAFDEFQKDWIEKNKENVEVFKLALLKKTRPDELEKKADLSGEQKNDLKKLLLDAIKDSNIEGFKLKTYTINGIDAIDNTEKGQIEKIDKITSIDYKLDLANKSFFNGLLGFIDNMYEESQKDFPGFKKELLDQLTKKSFSERYKVSKKGNVASPEKVFDPIL
jgi:hypothetical protein